MKDSSGEHIMLLLGGLGIACLLGILYVFLFLLTPLESEKLPTPPPLGNLPTVRPSVFVMPPVPSSVQVPSLRVITPADGDTHFCFGEEIVIMWESNGVKAVRIWLREATTHRTYHIATLPADYDEERAGEGRGIFQWHVSNMVEGVAIPEGLTYEVSVTAIDDENRFASAASDGVFALSECEG